MTKLLLTLIATVGLIGAGLFALDDTAGKSESAYKPVAPIDVIMENVDDIFSTFEKKVADKDVKKMKRMKKETLFLAELFNVTQFQKAEKDWREWSVKNRDQLKELSTLTEKGDAPALKSALETINKTCEACHEKYRDK